MVYKLETLEINELVKKRMKYFQIEKVALEIIKLMKKK